MSRADTGALTGAEDQHTERAERPVLCRSFDPVAVEIEGRTVDVRVVPFAEVARVADPPDWKAYDEEWMPGVFDHQLNAPNRIHANYEHMRGPTNVVGHGVSLRAESDGYHLTTSIHRTNAGDTTLELLNAGALPCVSLEAVAVRNVKTSTGVIQRVKANLRGFAFCRQGAFQGARVLAVRDEIDEPEQTVSADLMPVDLAAERVARLRALGIALPDRYTKAHPDDTDTPPRGGTSEDDTRRNETTNSLEE
jgi:HK97 family phage prohead protease